MERDNLRHHISNSFDHELGEIRKHVLAMGGLVERQLADAINAVAHGDSALGQQIADADRRVNAMELDLDVECTRILARRQPAAGDLRLVVGAIKIITDLERIGDESVRIGRMAVDLAATEGPASHILEVASIGTQVQTMLHSALDAYARSDPGAASAAARRDLQINQAYAEALVRHITLMKEDSRNLKRYLDLTWVVRALERAGDHAKNVCQHVIYQVKGRDVRHSSFDVMDRVAGKS